MISKLLNNGTKISKNRIKTLRAESKFENDNKITDFENFKDSDIPNIIRQNKDLVANNIIYRSISTNIGKEKYLQKFISTFLLNLCKDEEVQFDTKMEYFRKKFLHSDIELNNELSYVISEPFGQKRKDVLFTLLFYGTLLPDYSNQKQFNKEMEGLIFRLGKNLEKNLLKKPLNILPFEHDGIIDYMDLQQTCRVGGNFELEGVLDYVSYEIDLSELSTEINDDYRQVAINLGVSKFNGKGIDSNDIKNLLSNNDNFLRVSDDKYMIMNTSTTLDFYIRLFDTVAEAKEVDGKVKPKITTNLKIFTQEKEKLKLTEYLKESLDHLPEEVDDISELIYHAFGREGKGKNVKYTGYPKSPQIFDPMKNINDLLQESDDKEKNDGKLILGGGKLKKSAIYDVIDVKSEELDELLLSTDLRKQVNILIDRVNNPIKYEAFGVYDLPKGVLLYGPGGTGKTSICKEIGNKTKKESFFLSLKLDGIFNMYVGESEKAVREVFNNIRELISKGYLVYLFIDEVDGLIQKDQDSTTAGVRSLILSEMEGITTGSSNGMIVLATTNHIDKLSEAFKSRFNKTIHVNLPTQDERKELLSIYMKKYMDGIFDKSLDLDKLVSLSNGQSHRFIKNWVGNVVEDYVFEGQNGKIKNEYFERMFEYTKKKESTEENEKVIKPV